MAEIIQVREKLSCFEVPHEIRQRRFPKMIFYRSRAFACCVFDYEYAHGSVLLFPAKDTHLSFVFLRDLCVLCGK